GLLRRRGEPRRSGSGRRAVTELPAAAPTFDGLVREHPEWRGWLTVMQAALARAHESAWQTIAVTPALNGSAGAAWLAGARIEMDEGLALRWVRDLLRIAADAGAPTGHAAAVGTRRAAAVDAGAFLRAAVELDVPALEAAGSAGRPRPHPPPPPPPPP